MSVATAVLLDALRAAVIDCHDAWVAVEAGGAVEDHERAKVALAKAQRALALHLAAESGRLEARLP